MDACCNIELHDWDVDCLVAAKNVQSNRGRLLGERIAAPLQQLELSAKRRPMRERRERVLVRAHAILRAALDLYFGLHHLDDNNLLRSEENAQASGQIYGFAWTANTQITPQRDGYIQRSNAGNPVLAVVLYNVVAVDDMVDRALVQRRKLLVRFRFCILRTLARICKLESEIQMMKGCSKG